jgi:hypothetical protein
VCPRVDATHLSFTPSQSSAAPFEGLLLYGSNSASPSIDGARVGLFNPLVSLAQPQVLASPSGFEFADNCGSTSVGSIVSHVYPVSPRVKPHVLFFLCYV